MILTLTCKVINFTYHSISTDLTAFAQKQCNFKQSCRFKGTSELLGNPCPKADSKYTRIVFNCTFGESHFILKMFCFY